MLKADDQAEYALLLEQLIQSEKPVPELCGVQYVIEQGDSFSFPRILTEPVQSYNDNFAAQKSVASALYFDQFQLFGSVKIHDLARHSAESRLGSSGEWRCFNCDCWRIIDAI